MADYVAAAKGRDAGRVDRGASLGATGLLGQAGYGANPRVESRDEARGMAGSGSFSGRFGCAGELRWAARRRRRLVAVGPGSPPTPPSAVRLCCQRVHRVCSCVTSLCVGARFTGYQLLTATPILSTVTITVRSYASIACPC